MLFFINSDHYCPDFIRTVVNFIMNLCSALTAYCFFDNKPEAQPVHIEKAKQWNCLHTNLIPN